LVYLPINGDIPVSVGLNGQMYLPAAVVGSASTTDDIKITDTPRQWPAAVDHVHRYFTGDTDGILADLITCEPICRLEPAEEIRFDVRGARWRISIGYDGEWPLSVGWGR
jgi:hypothetical protein